MAWTLSWRDTILNECSYLTRNLAAASRYSQENAYVTAVCAVGATIFGSVYNFETPQTAGIRAAPILGNISDIIAPFMTQELQDSSEDMSAVIKMTVDAVGNLGAAATVIA
jgi:hypothetical protein